MCFSIKNVKDSRVSWQSISINEFSFVTCSNLAWFLRIIHLVSIHIKFHLALFAMYIFVRRRSWLRVAGKTSTYWTQPWLRVCQLPFKEMSEVSLKISKFRIRNLRVACRIGPKTRAKLFYILFFKATNSEFVPTY